MGKETRMKFMRAIYTIRLFAPVSHMVVITIIDAMYFSYGNLMVQNFITDTVCFGPCGPVELSAICAKVTQSAQP